MTKIDIAPIYQDEAGLKPYLVTNFRRIQDAIAALVIPAQTPHPDLVAHDTLGLATQAELDAHALTAHGGTHPNLAAHDTLGLATQAELDAHGHSGYASTGHSHGALTVPICQMSLSASFNVDNNIDTLLGVQVVDWESFPGQMGSGGQGIIIPAGWSGYYIIGAHVKWGMDNSAGGKGGYRSLHLFQNSTLVADHHLFFPEGTTLTMANNVTRGIRLVAGDLISAYILQQHTSLPGVRAVEDNTHSGILTVAYQGPV